MLPTQWAETVNYFIVAVSSPQRWLSAQEV